MAKTKPAGEAEATPTAFYTLKGLNYWAAGKPKRVEAGEVVTDIPEISVPWLLECGAIREATADDISAAKEVA